MNESDSHAPRLIEDRIIKFLLLINETERQSLSRKKILVSVDLRIVDQKRHHSLREWSIGFEKDIQLSKNGRRRSLDARFQRGPNHDGANA